MPAPSSRRRRGRDRSRRRPREGTHDGLQRERATRALTDALHNGKGLLGERFTRASDETKILGKTINPEVQIEYEYLTNLIITRKRRPFRSSLPIRFIHRLCRILTSGAPAPVKWVKQLSLANPKLLLLTGAARDAQARSVQLERYEYCLHLSYCIIISIIPYSMDSWTLTNFVSF